MSKRIYNYLKINDLKDMLNKTGKLYANRPAYKIKIEEGKYQIYTHKEVRDMINNLGTALIDLGLKGKRIAVIGENRYEWEIAYLSIVCGTGIVVPLDKSLPANELELLIERSDIEAIFYTKKYSDIIQNIRYSEKNKLKHLISMDNDENFDGIYSQKELIREGKKLIEEGNKEFLNAQINPKEMMKKAGVPVIPGSDGSIKGLKDALEIAKNIGYPVILKAAAGGGGKGIRVANTAEELEKEYEIVKQEAKNSFNDDEIYIEKFIENPRHVEIQIVADEHGNVIHLGERDCTIQRNHQKVIEETPSTAIDEKTRNKMGNAAIKAAKAAGYTSLGTVEFLVDKDNNFYFMEMNTRIQVEHPITEMRTGIDLVKTQIKIATGEKLKIKQKDVEFKGHSIECRLNAENPSKKFMPCPGLIKGLHFPGGNGVRIDSSIYEGYTIPSNYDSMIAKLITFGVNRNEAISKMKRVLEELVVEGIQTNQDFLFEIIKNPNFIRGNFDTSFIEKEIIKKETTK